LDRQRSPRFLAISHALLSFRHTAPKSVYASGRLRENHPIYQQTKEDKVDRTADGAELRRLDGDRPQERDRDLRQVEVKLLTAADEEGAGEELAVLAVCSAA
jgi:hypothetical protein